MADYRTPFVSKIYQRDFADDILYNVIIKFDKFINEMGERRPIIMPSIKEQINENFDKMKH